ncbi:MAG: hypothetical protein L3J73_04760 [Thermoplasmata archaeon]|nr:hypothetical protein [Thermoplasmata archaeon]
MTVDSPPTTAERDPHALAARLNRRLAQLDWPIVAEVDRDASGPEYLRIHRTSSEAAYTEGDGSMRVGVASLARPHALESILEELRARGWNRGGERPAPRADVFWCAPA